jgi:hypothetical protein
VVVASKVAEEVYSAILNVFPVEFVKSCKAFQLSTLKLVAIAVVIAMSVS